MTSQVIYGSLILYCSINLSFTGGPIILSPERSIPVRCRLHIAFVVTLIASLCVGVAGGTTDELAVLRLPDLHACAWTCGLILAAIPGHVRLEYSLLILNARF